MNENVFKYFFLLNFTYKVFIVTKITHVHENIFNIRLKLNLVCFCGKSIVLKYDVRDSECELFADLRCPAVPLIDNGYYLTTTPAPDTTITMTTTTGTGSVVVGFSFDY